MSATAGLSERTPSRYRVLRGKSMSSSKPVEIFREVASEIAQRSPRRRGRSNTASSRTGPLTEQSPNVPPLPAYAFTPKITTIPPPPTFKFRDGWKHAGQKNILTEAGPSTQREQPQPKTTDEIDASAQAERDDVERRRIDEIEAARWAEEVARLEAETDRILAEQKKRDLARLQTQLSTPPPKVRSPMLGKLAMFTRRKGSNFGSQPGTPTSINTAVFSSNMSRGSSLETSSSPLAPKFSPLANKHAPFGSDVPLSAVNGPERRVTIRCLSSTITLPVTLETSPVDVLCAAAELLQHHISPATCIVIETYVVLGLERRLRRYERIRDVLNTWDRDTENVLQIVSCDGSRDDRDLDIGSVPRSESPLPGFHLQLYHSCQPGKWNKRWVTLQDNGQMYASKRPDAIPGDKDLVALCHLSDFDIYSPKESEIRTSLKPPKRFCYAVKSQQKTVVFTHGDNFVHFFCSDDERLALRFYEQVQGWRSWYIVNRQVSIEKKLKAKAPQISLGSNRESGSEKSEKSQKSSTETGLSQLSRASYRIGTFEPLLDLNGFDKLAAKAEKLCREHATAIKQPLKKDEPLKDEPVVEEETFEELKLTRASLLINKIDTPKEKVFSSGGLLGESYDKMKGNKIQDAEPTTIIKVSSPFTETPTLLNGGVSGQSEAVTDESHEEPRSWFPSATAHSAQVRSRSQSRSVKVRRPVTAEGPQRRPPPPLINFTGPMPLPPRFHDTKGHPVRAPAGSPLINMANGEPLPPPPKGIFTRSASAGAPHTRPRSRSATMGSPRGPRNLGPGSPPVPPLPSRSMRRQMAPLPPPSVPPPELPRGRDPRPRELLIAAAR